MFKDIHKGVTHLEVEFGVFLLEYVCHVIDEVQTKRVLRGNFLQTYWRVIVNIHWDQWIFFFFWQCLWKFAYVFRWEFDAGGVMLRDLCRGQLGHGSRSTCATVNTPNTAFRRWESCRCAHNQIYTILLHCNNFQTEQRSRAWIQVNSPAGLVDGGIGPCVKVDDSGPAPLSSLLFIIVTLDGSEKWRAGGREGRFVPQRWRGPLPWPGRWRAHYTHAACQSNPE